jgi:glycosyltransferase 2 family protein
MVALIARNEPSAIFGLISRIGWGLVAIVLVRACTLVVAGFGWTWLVQPFATLNSSVFVLLRWIRESINVLLPVVQVGGDLMGGRLLTFWGVSAGVAVASILVDLLIQLGTQVVFTLLGVVVLALNGADRRLIEYVGVGLVLSAAGLSGFYFVQRSELVRKVEDALIQQVNRWRGAPPTHGPRLHESLRAIHRHTAALFASSLLHQAAWFFGILEIWIALTCMGLNPGWGECFVLESLGQALRSAAFSVPGALGVQEGGFIMLGSLDGLAPEACLALSLVKRVPDWRSGFQGCSPGI